MKELLQLLGPCLHRTSCTFFRLLHVAVCCYFYLELINPLSEYMLWKGERLEMYVFESMFCILILALAWECLIYSRKTNTVLLVVERSFIYLVIMCTCVHELGFLYGLIQGAILSIALLYA